MWAGTIALSPFGPGAVASISSASPEVIGSLLYLGVCCSAIGYLTWAYVLKHASAAMTSSLLALIPP